MCLPYTLAAVRYDGKIVAKNLIMKKDLKSYLCDLELDLLDEIGYRVILFPLVFAKDVKAALLGKRPIPHSSEHVDVSKYLLNFFSKVEKLKDDYVIITISNGKSSEYTGSKQILHLLEEEKRMFKENTGVVP